MSSDGKKMVTPNAFTADSTINLLANYDPISGAITGL